VKNPIEERKTQLKTEEAQSEKALAMFGRFGYGVMEGVGVGTWPL
jgi:hypothetical protein